MPNLPDSDYPDRKEWFKTAQKIISSVDLSKLIIIGHSLGVTTALDLVEKLNIPINTLISVSGFSEDYGADLNSYFLKEKSINLNKINQNLTQAVVIYGDDDPYVPQETLKSLADQLKVKPKIFPKGGHLNTETGYTTFPYLFEIFKGLALK